MSAWFAVLDVQSGLHEQVVGKTGLRTRIVAFSARAFSQRVDGTMDEGLTCVDALDSGLAQREMLSDVRVTEALREELRTRLRYAGGFAFGRLCTTRVKLNPSVHCIAAFTDYVVRVVVPGGALDPDKCRRVRTAAHRSYVQVAYGDQCLIGYTSLLAASLMCAAFSREEVEFRPVDNGGEWVAVDAFAELSVHDDDVFMDFPIPLAWAYGGVRKAVCSVDACKVNFVVSVEWSVDFRMFLEREEVDVFIGAHKLYGWCCPTRLMPAEEPGTLPSLAAISYVQLLCGDSVVQTVRVPSIEPRDLSGEVCGCIIVELQWRCPVIDGAVSLCPPRVVDATFAFKRGGTQSMTPSTFVELEHSAAYVYVLDEFKSRPPGSIAALHADFVTDHCEAVVLSVASSLAVVLDVKFVVRRRLRLLEDSRVEAEWGTTQCA